MAKKTNAGRPSRPDGGDTKEGKATANLQYRLDRACVAINDHRTLSVSAAFGRAAKSGVPRETALAALEALKACVADAEEALATSYAAPEDKAPEYQPRVSLMGE